MKRLLNYIKNTSIRIQLVCIFIAIGIAIGSVSVVSLTLNYRTIGKYRQYLKYISMISELSEITNESKKIVGELIYEVEGNEEEQMMQMIQEASELIEEVRLKTTSVDINLRLRVFQYLFQPYEMKGKELIALVNNSQHALEQDLEKTAQYTIYLEMIDILNRMDTYIQEMITCSVQENEELLKQTSGHSKILQYTLVVVVMAVIGIAIYLGLRYSRYLEGLIGKVLKLTKRISAGHKTEVLEVQEGPEEIREMTSSFNSLIMTMEILRQKADEKVQLELKLAEEELEKSRMSELLKEAQLQGLQFQIQPHFLFNTLNMIAMNAIMENDRKVYDLIMALSKFMRYSLKKATHLVHLQEEVDMIHQYLYILKARMGDQLEYEVKNDVSRQVKIPLFTLQPIVENAFRHGLEDKMGKGKIMIRITERDNRMILRVYNDGIGMEREALNQLRMRCRSHEIRMDQEKHIGIENVVHRLDLLFGKAVMYQIYSSDKRGTLFTIQILLS